MANKNDLSLKILASIGELAVIASLFPYQISVNRKAKSFGARSLLFSVKSEVKTDEEGNTTREWRVNVPGFAFREALDSIEKKIPKNTRKKLVLRRKKKQNEDVVIACDDDGDEASEKV